MLSFFIVSIITLEAHHECIFNIFTKCNLVFFWKDILPTYASIIIIYSKDMLQRNQAINIIDALYLKKIFTLIIKYKSEDVT